MVKCTRQVQTRHIFVRTTSNFAKQISNVDIIDFCKNKWKSGSDCHCDVIFYWKITKLVVKCTRQVQTRHIFVRTTQTLPNKSPMSTLLMFTKNNWKSGSDCHCDIIFHWKMTKLVVKCIRQVQTRHIFVGTISNFAKQISNVDIIDFCKKNDENRILTVTVTSLLIIIFDPKWQGSWWNALGKSKCGIHF